MKDKEVKKVVKKQVSGSSKKVLLMFSFFIIILSLIIVIGVKSSYLKKIKKEKLQIVNKLENCTRNLNEKTPTSINPQPKETKKVSVKQIPKKRNIGNDCYRKDENGADDLYNLNPDFNSDNSNITHRYINKAIGISFDIPYNKSWGNNNCIILPYLERGSSEDNSFSLEFGKFRAWIAGEFSLKLSERQDLSKILNSINEKNGKPSPNARIRKMGQLEVLVYESYEMSTEQIVIVSGEKYNYKFSNLEMKILDPKKNLEKIKKIIDSVKFE